MSSTTSEYRQIAAALRRVMKGRKITYEDLGARLGVSSRTAKRIIHGDDYPVGKIAEVCDVIGIKFFDLMQLAHEEQETSFQLTVEQEEYFAASLQHYLFLQELLRDRSLDAIRTRHGLSRKDTDRYLRELEKTGVLERFTGESFRLKVRGGHNFISNGPLERAIGRRDLLRFMEHHYERPEGTRCFSTSSGTAVSRKTIEEFTREAGELAAKYRLIAQRERSLLPETDLVRVRWLLGIVYPFDTWVQEIAL
jgi:transcriptional regulator with XRE-family HTH domain